MKPFFERLYRNLRIPVIVCEDGEGYPLAYANTAARLLLNPKLSVDNLMDADRESPLTDLMRFQNAYQCTEMFRALDRAGYVSGFSAYLVNYAGEPVTVSVDANTVEPTAPGDARHYALYLYDQGASAEEVDGIGLLTAVFHAANHTEQADEAIDSVLAIIGSGVKVSRAYVFEEISEEATRNTYEWCAPGVLPAIQDLQNLRKTDYPYDVIVSSGLFVTDDIEGLPEGSSILSAQGIKSLAILPLIHAGRAMGYIGFDDCERARKWSAPEIAVLENVASVVVSLIVRRNSAGRLVRSKAVLQTITDNLSNVIYVNDVHTYEIIFLNKALADSLQQSADDLMGSICYKRLQRGMEGPCPFCPMPKMIAEGMLENGGTFTWEFQNTVNKRWYLVRDSFIKWIDGRDVHIETATEITTQKEYEEQLKHYASIDMMTGAYNREWGTKLMTERMAETGPGTMVTSLAFIDLDGLKAVNDTFGHDAGDDMILTTVGLIRACVRKSDIICRWGGDEFILLLMCGVEEARGVLAKIENRLEAYNRESGKPYKLGISYGITRLTPKGSVDEVVGRADQLMYAHKMGKR